MKPNVHNRLAEIRKSRGIGASDLARRVDVSRQTIYAIEAGTYIPNTEVALRLARELEVTVDELFALESSASAIPESISMELLSSAESKSKSEAARVEWDGQPVRICRVGSRWVSVPVSATPYYLPEADGVIRTSHAKPKAGGKGKSHADVVVFAKEESAQKRLMLAGCDPATGLLSRMVERASGVEVVSAAASSRLAIQWLKEGKVHIAGSHLEDAKTGEFNLPFIRREFPDGDFSVVTFARWEEGLVTAPGNPKSILKIDDLARGEAVPEQQVRWINREPGSGSRALLDQLLAKAGIPAAEVPGYDRVAYGHLAAAYAVASGEADACLATRSAARTFGLDFIPLHSERYDLVMRKQTAELPAVRAFLDILQRSALRRKLEVLAGYDTSETGAVLA